jgi:hypothetical protein
MEFEENKNELFKYLDTELLPELKIELKDNVKIEMSDREIITYLFLGYYVFHFLLQNK